ncbi:MAG TPA: ATP-grasp domain-containing protein [Gemmatimonadales bacterium]|nr:ATP-grasp domain-containing protein [Gemmatimonadales bacterium]
MPEPKPTIAVLFNHVGEDEYEKLRNVDPATLTFEPEYELNVATVIEEYKDIAKALRREGYRVRMVNVQESIDKLERVFRRNPPDVIFNLIEHFHDEPHFEADVAALLELHRIPYTGAPPFALSLCQRKGLTKQILLANGVPTPRFRSLMSPKIPARHGLHYPLIVKPAREDASSGVEKASVVYDYAQLKARLEFMFTEFEPPVLVEEFIEGRELHVSVLGNEPPDVLPIIEFDFSNLPADHPNIISYDAKWNPLDEAFHRVHSICPADLSRRVVKKVRDIALRAYLVTGCRDYARLDFRLAPPSNVYVLEVNPNPDLTEGVSFMESAEAAGLSFDETLRMIVEFARERTPPPLVVPAPPPEVPNPMPVVE